MAEARQLKQREYFTNVIAHDVTPTKHTRERRKMEWQHGNLQILQEWPLQVW